MKTAAFSAAELRFGGWIPRAPDLSDFYAKGRGGLQPGASRDCGPPWGGRPKAGRAAGSFARRSGKVDRAARTSSRRSAKADRAARTSSRRSAKADRPARSSPRRSAKADRVARTSLRRSGKADNGGRLCPDGAFPAARPAGTARFLITRGKASFYETATFGRRKVFFCSPFCGLLFCPTRAKLALPAGKSPPPEPRPPRGGPPNDRDRLPVFAPPARTPAPATPPQSACSRRLSGCPQRPNLSARRRAESPKGKGKRKEEPRMKRAPPL